VTHPLEGLGFGPLSARGDEPLQDGDTRACEALHSEMLGREVKQEGWLLMLSRPIDHAQPGDGGSPFGRQNHPPTAQ
jgi:hypothetical protein